MALRAGAAEQALATDRIQRISQRELAAISAGLKMEMVDENYYLSFRAKLSAAGDVNVG